MGDAADMMLEGAVCQGCGQWMDDLLEGYDPPGHPRWCLSCKPVKRKKKGRRKKEDSGLSYKADAVIALLPNVPFQVYINHGAEHLKFDVHFNFWPSKGKWWDSVTNEKGKGASEFAEHVIRKRKAIAKSKENTHER